MTKINWGIVGLGLMGREFVQVLDRIKILREYSKHLPKVQLVHVCDISKEKQQWARNLDKNIIISDHYDHVINSSNVDAVYCALPHNMHYPVYNFINANGKMLLGEKPFGISSGANRLVAASCNDMVLSRCATQWLFYPGAYKIYQSLVKGEFGSIMDVRVGFHQDYFHSGIKAEHWKYFQEQCGPAGSLTEVGLHCLFLPIRMGWEFKDVRAILSKSYSFDFYNNNTLMFRMAENGQEFPMLLETKASAPGETNSWFVEINGTEMSAKYNSRYPKTLKITQQINGRQQWCELDVGNESAYPSYSGRIFEFGFLDGLTQMAAAFCDEAANGRLGDALYCMTPDETSLAHHIIDAALQSHDGNITVQL
jgi:predicted dehydrogenase